MLTNIDTVCVTDLNMNKGIMRFKHYNSFLVWVVLGMVLNGCAGVMHNYVSAPNAEGAVEKSKAELCFGRHLSSQAQSPSYIQFDFEKVSLCVESKSYPQESHMISIGPYFVIPLPIIPLPKGVYRLISPPEKK